MDEQEGSVATPQPSTYSEEVPPNQNYQQLKRFFRVIELTIAETTPVNQNIMAFFWAAFVFFIGLMVVVAQYTDAVPSFTFCKTYEMLTVFMILAIICMSYAIGMRNNSNFCCQNGNDDHDDDHEDGMQSKYLIGNAYVFAAGNILSDMFSIASVFHCGIGDKKNPKNCYVSISIFHICRIMFTSLQLIFLQVFTSMKVKKRCYFPFKIFVSHVIATDALIWFTFLCLETGILNGDSTNNSEYTLNCINNLNDSVYSTAKSADEKLQPFILEFSLLAASLLYAICPIRTANPLGSSTSRKNYCYKSIETVTRDDSKKYKSDPGLLVGILSALILILSSWSLDDVEHYIDDLRFNYSMQILTHIMIITIGGWVYYELRKFHIKKKAHKRKYQIDDYLLLFTGTCSALPFMFTIFFSVWRHIDDNSQDNHPSYLKEHEHEVRIWMGFVCVFTVASVLFQTFFLLEAHSYDRAMVPDNSDASQYRKLRSAARIGQLFLLLLMLNFGFWVTNSFFELHNDLARTYPIAKLYWKKKAWGFITKLLYPILIFFRFHSVAIIAHIWLDFSVKEKSH